MIKVLHTADVHFGVENYGKIDPKTGLHTRLLDFVKAFSFCVDSAIKNQVDLFVLAGDAYKTANPTPTQQKFLLRELFRLQKAGIPVAIVVGNHDHPLSFGKAHALDVYADLPVDGFHVFAKPSAVKIETKNGPVQVVGIPWPTRQNILSSGAFCYKDSESVTEQISKSVSKIIADLAKTLDPAIPAVLTGHLTVNSGVFSGSERKAVFGSDPLFFVSQLAIEPFNYVALGHLHRFQDLNKKGSVPVVYSGSPERIDFGEVRDTKGYCLVTLETKLEGNNFVRTGQYEFKEIPTRPMVEIKVKLEQGLCFTEQILDRIKQHNLLGAIVKIFYFLPQDAKDNVDLAKVNGALSKAWHIASIIPVHDKSSRGPRMKASQKSTPVDLVRQYLEMKNFDTEKKSRILQKASEIIEKVEKDEGVV